MQSEHGALIVPHSQRRGPVTMGLLWLTMVTCFPTVLIGFEWFKQGLSLFQVIVCSIVSCMMLLLYTVPIAHIAAVTGKGYGILNGQMFGRRIGAFMNASLIVLFIGFYGLASLLLAEALQGLFHPRMPLYALASALAFLMAFNNFFGFKGIANFARFIAAPLIIGWVCYTFFKAVPACTQSNCLAANTQPWWFAFSSVSSFVIGFAIWGNEADYWRYGKPRLSYGVLPLAVALTVGEIIFPTTGWMVAKLSGVTDFGAATNYMNNYSFGGIPAVAALVLSVSYFACNDSCLFGSAGALQIMLSMRHRTAVAILTVLGMLTAFALSICGAAKALEGMVSINSVVLPIPTLVVIAEWLLAKRLGRRPFETVVTSRAAKIALFAGSGLGIATSGVLPGTQSLHCGSSFLAAWLLTLALFLFLRLREYRQAQLPVRQLQREFSAAGR